MSDDVEKYFIYLLSIWILDILLVKCLFKLSAHFSIELYVFF